MLRTLGLALLGAVGLLLTVMGLLIVLLRYLPRS
jgi:hypothetical protein